MMANFEKLKIIEVSKGNVMHALRCDSASFKGFGEAYFSSIQSNEVKAWKLHKKGTCNLVVPCGEVKFVIYNAGEFEEFNIGPQNYGRLTIPPGFWFGFKGIGRGDNIILNILDIIHDPNESESKSTNDLNYIW